MSSNSVLRRYTPPTCSLEIAAKSSPLSRWVGRPVLKQIEFLLNFDDPRLPEDKRVTIQGDKAQLEELREAVTSYVQEFLEQPPGLMNGLQIKAPSEESGLSEESQKALPPAAETSATGETHKFNGVSPESENNHHYPASHKLDASASTESQKSDARVKKENQLPNLAGIYLRPNGLFSHDLFLGSLATEKSGKVIHLSLLQLFDLATALDEYSAEVDALPNLDRKAKRKSPPYWAVSAAMVAATVGLSAGILKMLDRENRSPQVVPATISPAPSPTEQPQVALAPSPQPIQPTPGSLTPPATSPQTLPSLPPTATNATPSPAASPSPGNNLTLSPMPTPSVGNNLPVTPTPAPSLRAGVPTAPPSSTVTIPSNPNSSSLGSYYRIPTNPGTPSPGANRIPPTSPAVSSLGANRTPTSGTAYKIPSTPTSVPTIEPRIATRNSRLAETPVQLLPRETPTPQLSLPPFAPTEAPVAKTPSVSRRNAATPAKPTPSATPNTPEPSPSPTLDGAGAASEPLFSSTLRRQQSGEIAIAPHSGVSEVSPSPSPGAGSDIEKLAALRSPTPTASPSPSRSSGGDTSNNTLFDQIPQVAEARQYFQQRWQPPSSLTQDQLEYTLSLNADGSIKQIIPRGQVAQIYLDRTEMPLKGEPFVSAVEGGRNPEILLILHKNGKVETRLQSLN